MKYELFTTGEVRNFEELRSYVGRSEAVSVSDVTTGGLFFNDITDLSSSDDSNNTIVDYKGRRWKRVSGANISFSQSGTGAVARTVQDKLRDVVYVTDFMTSAQIADARAGTGSLDVTAAIQAAIDAADTIVFPPGTYKLVCLSTPVFQYGGDTRDVYRAVDINASNKTIIGIGATIKVWGHGAGVNDYNYAFATDKNMNIGDLSNITVRGLKFDFNPTGDVSSTKRSFYFGGVDGIFLHDLEIMSSGTRSGGTLTFQQSRTIRIANFRLKNCTQGMNFSYCYDVVGSNWQFDDFSEAVDFDRVVVGLNLTNLSFRNAGLSSQCIDLNSVQNAKISGISVDDVGNVVIVNYKDTTQATYADYVANAAVGGVFTISKDVTIEGIKGEGCSGIQLGFDRTAGYAGGGPLERITLRDVQLKTVTQTAGAPLRIEDVKDFVVEDVYLEDCTSITNTSWGAITVEADATYADAEVSGTFRNVHIKNCNLKGFRVSAPTKIIFDTVTVENFNTSNTANHGFAFDMQGLNNRTGQLFIDRTFAKTGQNSPVAWRFSESGGGAFESQIVWGDGNRIDLASVPTPISFGNANMQKRVKKRALVPFGTVTLSTAQSRDYPLLATTAKKGVRLCWATSFVTQASGGATNYISTDVRSVVSSADASVATATTYSSSVNPGVESDLGLTYNETAAQLAPGDIAYLRLNAQGTGGTLHGFGVYVHFMDYVNE